MKSNGNRTELTNLTLKSSSGSNVSDTFSSGNLALQKKGDNPEHNKKELILKYLPLVEKIAKKISIRVPDYISLSELISAGYLGIVIAAEKFDPSKGSDFEKYAEFRIRGSILDELRKFDTVARQARRKTRAVEKITQRFLNEHGLLPSIQELATLSRLTEEDVISAQKNMEMQTFLLPEDIGIVYDQQRLRLAEIISEIHEGDQLDYLLIDELLKTLKASIDALPKQEKLTIALYYLEDLNYKQIGAVLEVSESRICQIHQKAIDRLRDALREYRKQN